MAAPATQFNVEGLGDVLRVLKDAPDDIRKDVRKALRAVAIPIRDDATARFLADVNPDRRRTKYGISLRQGSVKWGIDGSVSVEQRLRRSRDVEARRPAFAVRQKKYALLPALETNEDRVVDEIRDVLDDLERRWGRAGD